MDTKPPLRVVALLNVTAGSIEGHPGKDICEIVRAAFTERGITCEVEAVPGGKLLQAAKRALQKAKGNEVDAIVAGGGDGTIHTVASVLAGTRIPLGILPFGTLNHFATDLGIPLDVNGAVDVIAAGHGMNVDVGEVNGIIFVNNSSIGVYPYMVLDRERLRRRAGLRKWTAMALAGLHMLRVFPVRRLRVRAEGWAEPCRTPCLFVGNNKYTFSLKALGKRERLDGGELWFYIVKYQTRLSLLWFTLRSLIGLAYSEKDLRAFGVKHADIRRARKKRLAVALDGEVVFLRPPLHFRIRPGELRVFAPIPPELQQTSA